MKDWTPFKNLQVFRSLRLKKNAYIEAEQPNGSTVKLTTNEIAQLNQALALNTGTVYYVDSNNGSSGYAGTTKELPKATWDQAINLCSAGDVIVLLPNHSEDITSAAAVDLDVAGITTVGIGVGSRQPQVTFSNSAATVEVNAAAVVIDNVRFSASVTGVVIGVDIKDGADDYRITNCRFDAVALTTDEFVDAIFVTTSDRGVIAHNDFDMDEAGAASAIHLVGACLGVKITGNSIKGDYSVACIEGVTAAGEQYEIWNNRLVNGVHSGLNAVACISLFTGTTGFIEDNKLYCNVATPDLSIVADGCFLSGNRYSETAAGADEELYTTRQPDSTYNFIGVDDANNAAATTNVAANEDGSILERLEQLQEAINVGTGTSLPANTSIYDTIVGTDGVSNPAFGTLVTKSDGDPTAATDSLFTVTGKNIITLLSGEVTTTLAGSMGAVTVTLQTTTNNRALCGATTVSGDTAGTLYIVTGDTDAAMNGGAAPSDDITSNTTGVFAPLIVDGDGIEMATSAATTLPTAGVIQWELWYFPAESGATVAAAA